MEYALIVFFSCAGGCGTPSQFTVQQPYQAYGQCDAAGKVWLSPDANPDQAGAGYRCAPWSTEYLSAGAAVRLPESEKNHPVRGRKEHQRGRSHFVDID